MRWNYLVPLLAHQPPPKIHQLYVDVKLPEEASGDSYMEELCQVNLASRWICGITK